MPAILSRVLALSVALLPAPAAGRLILAPRAHGAAELDVHKVASHVSLRQDAEGRSVDTLAEDADSSGHRLAGLAEVERDLESTETQEDSEIKQLDEQIASLLQKRNALKVEKARRAHDVAFVKAEASRLRKRAGSASTVSASSASNATAGADASAESGAEAAAAAAEAEAEAEASRAAADHQLQQQESEKEAAQAAEVAAAQEKQRAKEAAAAKQKEIAEARAKAKAEAQEEEHRRRMQEDAEYRAQEEKRQQMDEMADSADDSFKQFMKEEDGEDEQGDADYEDSANALAGAIGWNRHEIESKADNAVKQLTEAIGGKKVVQSLQGMMAGVR